MERVELLKSLLDVEKEDHTSHLDQLVVGCLGEEGDSRVAPSWPLH